MKIRTDFVTNSSSSSFIVVFKTKKDYEDSMAEVERFYGSTIQDELIYDIDEGKIDKAYLREIMMYSLRSEGMLLMCRKYGTGIEGEHKCKQATGKSITEMGTLYAKEHINEKMDTLTGKYYKIARLCYSDNDYEADFKIRACKNLLKLFYMEEKC